MGIRYHWNVKHWLTEIFEGDVSIPNGDSSCLEHQVQWPSVLRFVVSIPDGDTPPLDLGHVDRRTDQILVSIPDGRFYHGLLFCHLL